MTCPNCGGKTIVVCTRSDSKGVYRRRKCTKCRYIIFTSETESDGADFTRLNNEAIRASIRRAEAAKAKNTRI
jgi:transcriptional regulator NrdR family protein